MTFMKKFSLLVLILIPILMTNCSKSSVKKITGDRGGSLLIGITGRDVPRSNQALHPLFTGKNPISEQLFLPLITRDVNGKLIPILAERWEFSEDLSAIVYYLRKEVKWSDGEEFTAEDVKFTFDFILNNPEIETPFRMFFEKISSVEILGKYSVKVNFTEPYSTELFDSDIYPLPEHILADVNTWEAFLNSEFGRKFENTVSNGPFKLLSVSSDEIILISYEDYYRDQPPIDSIVFKFFNSSSEMVRALETKKINSALNVFPSFVNRLSSIEHIKLQVDDAGNRYYSIGWITDKSPLDNSRFRYALTLSIDRERLVDELLNGEGRVPASPLSPHFWAYDSTLTPITYDVLLANSILDSLGLKDREWIYTEWRIDTVEVRGRIRPEIDTVASESIFARKHEGEVIVLKLVSFDRSGEYILNKIANHLSEVGIICSTLVIPSLDEVKEKLAQGEISGYVLDYALVGEWTIHPKEIFGSEGRLNFAKYSSNVIDSLLDAATATLDRREAKIAWNNFQMNLLDQQPFTFLFVQSEVNAVENIYRGEPVDIKLVAFNLQEIYIPSGSSGEIIVATGPESLDVSIDTLEVAEVDTIVEDTVAEEVEVDTLEVAEVDTTAEDALIEEEELIELASTGALLEEAVATGSEGSIMAEDTTTEETTISTIEETLETTEETTTSTTTVFTEDTTVEETTTIPEETTEPTETVRTNPQAINLPQARVPEAARGMGIARAFVRVTIGSDGSVISSEIVGSSGNPLADNEARNAAMGAKFTPATENGIPVQSTTVIPINFVE